MLLYKLIEIQGLEQHSIVFEILSLNLKNCLNLEKKFQKKLLVQDDTLNCFETVKNRQIHAQI